MNIKVSAGQNYFCPRCGEPFRVRHLHGDCAIDANCNCFHRFQEGFIKISESKIKYPKMVIKQPPLMAYLKNQSAVKSQKLM